MILKLYDQLMLFYKRILCYFDHHHFINKSTDEKYVTGFYPQVCIWCDKETNGLEWPPMPGSNKSEKIITEVVDINMNNKITLTYTDLNGFEFKFPVWVILRAIDNLSNEDKADLATVIVDMIGGENENELVLSVLRQRCMSCGKNLYGEKCYCMAEE